MTAVGNFLIYRLTHKLVSFYKDQLSFKWWLFIIHILALLLLIVTDVLDIPFTHSDAVIYVQISINACVCVLICYIVAAYSGRNKNPLFITFKKDGNVFFDMRVTRRLTEPADV